ncbi:hypothetical protein [Haloarcula halophila]|uniref:hypothetical protein n=1 Tax=Haloarcula TaxID=2237 RepID=UPI0023E40F2B|nr:hypothetical protein [Halomicroarcula sp. DFY41]
MQRREFVSALSAGIAASSAGCIGSLSESDSTPTEQRDTQTPTATRTETPTATQTEKSTDTPTETRTPPPKPPEHMFGLEGRTVPRLEDTSPVTRKFTQSIGRMRTEFTIRFAEQLYDYYQGRVRTGNYGAYTSDTFDKNAISGITNSLEAYRDRNDMTDRQMIDHAIAWVQGMEYTQDKPATGYNEYPKYPLETLYDRGGDCEDTAILLAEVFNKLGYGSILIELPQAKHMAVGVKGNDEIPGAYYTKNGNKYYYVETTGSGWRVGEVPDDVKQQGAQANLLPVNKYPSLSQQWLTGPLSNGKFETLVAVFNFGTRPATSAEVQVELETEGGEIVAQKRKSVSTVGPTGRKEVKFTLDPPEGTPVRLRSGVVSDGTVVDLSESDMQSPD